jgi:hypothetical protein
MITIVALAALLLGAGSVPEHVGAAPGARIGVTQSVRESPGFDTFNVKGSGYPPSTGLFVHIDTNAGVIGDQPTTTDSRGRWDFGIGVGCGLYQTVTFSTTAPDATKTVNAHC